MQDPSDVMQDPFAVMQYLCSKSTIQLHQNKGAVANGRPCDLRFAISLSEHCAPTAVSSLTLWVKSATAHQILRCSKHMQVSQPAYKAFAA